MEFQYQSIKNEQDEYTEKQDIVDLKSTMKQFNITKIYTIFIQQQDTSSVHGPIDYKLDDTIYVIKIFQCIYAYLFKCGIFQFNMKYFLTVAYFNSI